MLKTPKFFLFVKQHGEGCAYTIGCGATLEPLLANSLDEAKCEADTWLYEHENSECSFDKALIIDVKGIVEVDVDAMRAAKEAFLACGRAAMQEIGERLQYEKLKAKYGK